MGGWTVNAGPEPTYEEKWEYQPLWLKTGALDKRPGAVLSFFFFIRRLGPSIYRSSPKKVSGISSTPTVVKKAQLNGNRKSTSNDKYVVKTDIFIETNLVQTWTKSVKKQALMISDHMYTTNTPPPQIYSCTCGFSKGSPGVLTPPHRRVLALCLT